MSKATLFLFFLRLCVCVGFELILRVEKDKILVREIECLGKKIRLDRPTIYTLITITLLIGNS